MNLAFTLKAGKLLLNKCGGDKLVAFTPSLNDTEDEEPCCCCFDGCAITTITLIRPIVWPGVVRCATGWTKYENVSSHPESCRGNTDWRVINLPTCDVVASGKIINGKLEGLKDRACYAMPYGADSRANPNWPECTGGAPPVTFSSLLWLPLAYLSYATNLVDLDTLITLFSSIAVALHCDGDLSCRYVLQLQTACVKKGKLNWPSPNPCVKSSGGYSGTWGGGGGDFPVP